MVGMDFVFALIFALILAALLIMPLRRRGPGPISGFFFFFILIFLGTWAGGVWLGPTVGHPGVAWLGFLFVALILSLLLAAATPPSSRSRRAQPEDDLEATTGAMAVTFGIFFWLLIVLFIVGIAASYIGSV